MIFIYYFGLTRSRNFPIPDPAPAPAKSFGYKTLAISIFTAEIYKFLQPPYKPNGIFLSASSLGGAPEYKLQYIPFI
jgi:hypothetical protein